jgi:hypothetical protein
MSTLCEIPSRGLNLFIRRLLNTLGVLALTLSLLFGAGGGMVSACCPDLNGRVPTLAGASDWCLEADCHCSTIPLREHNPECASYVQPLRRTADDLNEGQEPRTKEQGFSSSQDFRLVVRLSEAGPFATFLKRRSPDPVLQSLCTVVLLT